MCQKIGIQAGDIESILIKSVCARIIYFSSTCTKAGIYSGEAYIETASIREVKDIFLRGASVKDVYIREACAWGTCAKNVYTKDKKYLYQRY